MYLSACESLHQPLTDHILKGHGADPVAIIVKWLRVFNFGANLYRNGSEFDSGWSHLM